MPQIQRTNPGTITFPAAPPQYPSGSAAATIAGFKAAILTLTNIVAIGNLIEAKHYTILAGIYNAYIQHTHAYSDLRGIDTFGNLPTYGGGTFAAPNPKQTSATIAFLPITVVTPAIGDSIDSTDYTTIQTVINAVRTHHHTIDDITS